MQQGEYEGAGAPSCWIECLQKARKRGRLRRAAAAFWTAQQTKKRGIRQAIKKVYIDFFDSL